MLTRRRFVSNAALSSSLLALRPGLVHKLFSQEARPLRIAVLGNSYRLGSELQQITDRFLIGYPYEGDWHVPAMRVVSLYLDEPIRRIEAGPTDFDRSMMARPQRKQGGAAQADEPSTDSDLSKSRSQEFGFRICKTIPEALRCGGRQIAVDAVLTVLDQTDYPTNDLGQVLLPHYDFFQQCAEVFATEKKPVPYFNHRQLAFSFLDAKDMVASSKRLNVPLMSGSSMAYTWRLPDVDLPYGAAVQEALVVATGDLQTRGWDALEAMQSMLERRKGGETGVKAVQFLEGDQVWTAAKAGRWSTDLLSSALSRSDTPLGLTVVDGRTQDLTAAHILQQLVRDPIAICLEYNDGTRATLLLLNGAVRDCNISIRTSGKGIVSAQFFMSPPPNNRHTTQLVAAVEQLFTKRVADHSVDRNLLLAGVMQSCMESNHRLNQRLETSQLNVKYTAPTESLYART